MKNYNIRAFTLIELLIVMGIIAVLAGMSLFALEGSRESARDARRKGDLETIRSGLELYKADCGEYPLAIVAGSPLNGDGTNCLAANVYIQTVPDDPIATDDYAYSPASPPDTYTLCAALEGVSTAASGCGSCVSTCTYRVDNP